MSENEPSTSATTTMPPMKKRGFPLFVLGILVSFGPFGMEIIIPTLPIMAQQLNTTSGLAAMTISSYTSTLGIAQLLVGPLSDVYGRRPLLLIGSFLYGISSLFACFATAIGTLLVMRVGQGLGSALAMSLAFAAIRDQQDDQQKRERANATLSTIRSIAPLLAPVVGSTLLAITGFWQAGLAANALQGLLAFAGVLLFSTESLPREQRQPRFSPMTLLHSYCMLMRSRDFIAWACPLSLQFGSLFVWISTSSFLLEGFYGMAPELFGPIYSITFVGSVLGSLLSPFVRRRLRISPSRLFIGSLGIGCLAASFLVLIFLVQPLAVLAQPTAASQICLQTGVVILALVSSIGGVQAQSALLEPFPRHAGAAMGFLGALRMASATTSASVFGNFHETPAAPSVGMLSFSAVALVMHWGILPRRQQRTGTSSSGTGGNEEEGQSSAATIELVAAPPTKKKKAKKGKTAEADDSEASAWGAINELNDAAIAAGATSVEAVAAVEGPLPGPQLEAEEQLR